MPPPMPGLGANYISNSRINSCSEKEDLAESFILYLALRYKSDRIDKRTKELIRKTMPNRIAYLDSVDFKIHPIKKTEQKNPPDKKVEKAPRHTAQPLSQSQAGI